MTNIVNYLIDFQNKYNINLRNANLILNIGSKPDNSLNEINVEILLKVANKLDLK